MSELINYEDYTKEIIDGKIYYMSPGTSAHVRVIRRLYLEFERYFDLKKLCCEAYCEGLEVFLDSKSNKNYVVPDISIICDESKFWRRGYRGAPELIVEVISSSTANIDRGVKFRTYEKYGVKEYWIADPRTKSIEQYALENGKYDLKTIVTLIDKAKLDELTKEQQENYTSIIKTSVFDGLEIDLNKIFLKTDLLD